jgi:plasmid replication initiation protein
MEKKIVVSQHNSLVNGLYSLTVLELRVFLMMLHEVRRGVDVFEEFDIALKEIEGLDMSNIHRQIDKIQEELTSIKLRLDYLNGQPGKFTFNVFRYALYYKGTGILRLRVEEKIKPYISNLFEQGNFTSADFKTLLGLPSFNSYRIYLLLKQGAKKYGGRVIRVDELKEMLQINTKAYALYANFKNRVIKQAEKDLENTDMAFTYKELKEGKKVVAIDFRLIKTIEIKPELAPKQQTTITDMSEVEKGCYDRMVNKLGLSDYQAKLVLQNEKDTKVIHKVCYEMELWHLNNKDKNIGAYAFKTFKEKYNL